MPIETRIDPGKRKPATFDASLGSRYLGRNIVVADQATQPHGFYRPPGSDHIYGRNGSM